MRHNVRAALALSCLIAFSATAQAQPAIRYQDAVTQPDGTVITQPVTVTPSKPLPVTGSFSATTTGFAPASTGTPISVTTGGVTGTLPAGAVVIASNVGATNNAYCKLGASATTSDQLISPNSWFAFTVGVATQLTCITSTSTTTVNMVGGSGLPTGAGGGGGGGGGAITAASGAFASGSIASGAVASGAVASGAVASGALAAGAGTDGWDVTQGTKSDVPCASGSTTPCSAEARLAHIENLAAASTPAGSAIIGKVGIDQTTDGTTNAVHLVAGTAIAGKVGIDQTTLGTTNAVQPIPGTSGGLTMFYLTAANSTNATNVKASAGQLYRADLSNNSATPAYVSFYNTSGTPTCGTSIVYQMMIPANSTSGAGWVSAGSMGLTFSSGIGICATTGIAGTGAVAASAYTISLGYK
jgi:hypothetical protein